MIGGSEAGGVIGLLDADRDLGIGLGGHACCWLAKRRSRGVIEITKHDRQLSGLAQPADGGWPGLFVLDGLVIRRVTSGPRQVRELFGADDLIRSLASPDEHDPLPVSVDWLVCPI